MPRVDLPRIFSYSILQQLATNVEGCTPTVSLQKPPSAMSSAITLQLQQTGLSLATWRIAGKGAQEAPRKLDSK